MRVNLGTIDIDDRVRRALNQAYGKPGLATRDDIRRYYQSSGDASIQILVAEMDDETEREQRKAANK